MSTRHPLDYHQPEPTEASLPERALHIILVVGGVVAGMVAGACVAAMCVSVLIRIFDGPKALGAVIAMSTAIGAIAVISFVAGGFVGGRAGIWLAARLGVAR